jgi:protein O-mannosyl-transferase
LLKEIIHSKKFQILVSILLLIIVNGAAFHSVLHCEFTNWDDDKYVYNNPTIRDLSWRNVQKIFTSFQYHWYFPLVTLSFALEYHFFELNPAVYHLDNLILHILNTLLVFWLILLLNGNTLSALLTALLFSLHPLRVESVAWVTERKDLMFALFFLLSFIAYVYYRRDSRVVYYLASLVFFAASLASKQQAAMLPFSLLLYDYFFRNGIKRRELLQAIPYVAISGIMVITILVVHHYASESTAQFKGLKFYHYLFVAQYVLVYYLYLTFCPLRLSAIYPFPDEMSRGGLPAIIWFSPVFTACLLALLALKKPSKTTLFGSLFFLINIFPMLQIIPIITLEIVADRFTYVPSIGLTFIVSEFLLWLMFTWSGGLKYRAPARAVFGTLIIALIGLSAFASAQRCLVWKDSYTLWNDVIVQYPRVWAAYNNRGTELGRRGDFEGAFSDLRQAIALNPGAPSPYNNRGNIFKRRGDLDRAIADFSMAIRLDPSEAVSYCNRGIAYAEKKDLDRAIADLSHALRIEPQNEGIRNNLKTARRELESIERSISDLTERAAREPRNAGIMINRGAIFFMRGDFERALADYSQAIKIDPNYAIAYYNRALAYSRKGDNKRAIEDFSRAITIDPKLRGTYKGRGMAWAKSGNYRKALSDFSRELGNSPGDIEAYIDRGTAYAQHGDYGRAIEDFTRALGINPHMTDLHYRRAAACILTKDQHQAEMDIRAIKEMEPFFDQRRIDELKAIFTGEKLPDS